MSAALSNTEIRKRMRAHAVVRNSLLATIIGQEGKDVEALVADVQLAFRVARENDVLATPERLRDQAKDFGTVDNKRLTAILQSGAEISDQVAAIQEAFRGVRKHPESFSGQRGTKQPWQQGA